MAQIDQSHKTCSPTLAQVNDSTVFFCSFALAAQREIAAQMAQFPRYVHKKCKVKYPLSVLQQRGVFPLGLHELFHVKVTKSAANLVPC